MDDFSPSFIKSLQAVAETSRRDMAEHPSTETLTAYHERRLSVEVSQELRRHIALCPDCARTLLDLEQFTDVETETHKPSPSPQPSEATQVQDWSRLEKRLGIVPEDHGGASFSPLPAKPIAQGTLRPHQVAIAAVLGAALLGLFWWLVVYQGAAPTAEELIANLQVIELSPAQSTLTRGFESEDQIELRPEDTSVLFLLALSTSPSTSNGFRAVLRKTSSDQSLLVRDGLDRLPRGGFSLIVPVSALLENEPLQIDLFDPSGQLVTSYMLSIRLLR